MKKEKPKPMIVRFYKAERKHIKNCAKYLKTSQAEVIRQSVNQFVLFAYKKADES